MQNNEKAAPTDSAASAFAWARRLAPYRQPSHARAVIELAITAGPFALLWVMMWIAIYFGYWIGLLLVVPAGGFLVRMFMIQHDCSHGSFFRHLLANDWVGRVISVLTLTPYDSGADPMPPITPVQAISIGAASVTSIR